MSILLEENKNIFELIGKLCFIVQSIQVILVGSILRLSSQYQVGSKEIHDTQIGITYPANPKQKKFGDLKWIVKDKPLKRTDSKEIASTENILYVASNKQLIQLLEQQVEQLWKTNALTQSFFQEARTLYSIRNSLIHGIAVPSTDDEKTSHLYYKSIYQDWSEYFIQDHTITTETLSWLIQRAILLVWATAALRDALLKDEPISNYISINKKGQIYNVSSVPFSA